MANYNAPYAAITVNDDSATVTSTQLTGILSVTIDEGVSTPTKVTISCDNKDNDFDPKNTSGAFYPYLSLAAGYSWNVAIYNSTGSYALTCLRLLDVQRSIDAKGKATATLTLYDASWRLTPKNQTMESWQSTASTTIWATTIMESIVAFFGMSHSIGTTNYPVKLKHFSGEKPLDVLKQMLAPVWGIYSVTGNTLSTSQPAHKPTGPADYVLTDYETIRALEVHDSRSSVCTRVEVLRTDAAGNLALDMEGTDTDQVVYCDLSFGVIAAQVKVLDSVFCSISGWTLFDSDDMSSGNWPLGPPGGTVTRVGFLVTSKAGITEAEAAQLRWHVQVKGRKPLSLTDFPSEYDENFHRQVINTTLETELGEQIPAAEPVHEDLVTSTASADDFGEGYLKESAKKLRTYSGSIGANYIGLKPDMTVQTVCDRLNVDDYVYVETTIKTLTDNSLSVTFTGSVPRADTFSAADVTYDEEEGE